MADNVDLEKRVFRLKKELKKDPKNREKWCELGTFLLQGGDTSSSLDMFNKALKIDPKYADALSGKGDALFRLNRLGDAKKCFTNALDVDPKNQNALYNLGIVSVSNRDWRLASLYFNRLLGINPTHHFASRWKKRLIKEMRHGERRVWLFTGTAETWQEKLGGGESWGAHENSNDIHALAKIARGDIVLAYRRPPNDDIVSIMEVDSWMYIDRSTAWSHRINIVPRIEIDDPIPMGAINKGNVQLSKIMHGTEYGTGEKMIYPVPPVMWGSICENIIRAAPKLKPQISDMLREGMTRGVEFNVDMAMVPSDLMVTEDVLMHILTALKSGRNVLLYGPAYSGKRKVLDFIAEQICGKYFDDEGRKRYNYTSCVGNGLWSERDVFGSWEFDSGEKTFRKGFFPRVLSSSVSSTRTIGRSHYLIIHNVDKGIASKSLMHALDSVTNRGTNPSIESDIPLLVVPRDFRVMATVDVENIRDLTTFADLRKNFILIEMEVPTDGSEYDAIPRMVHRRLMDLGVIGEDVIDAKTTSMQEREILESPFENDVDHSILHAYDKLTSFISEDPVPPPGKDISSGVRTYCGIGNLMLVDVMVGVVNTIPGYSRVSALEDSVISDILPAMSDLDKEALGNIMLRAIEVFGPKSKVVTILDLMVGNAALPPPNRKKRKGSALGEDTLMNSRGGTINIINPNEKRKGEDLDSMRKFEEEKRKAEEERRTAEEERRKAKWEKNRVQSRADMAKINEIPVDYDVNMIKVSWELSIHPAVVDQIRTNLESGRNVILYGPPGCGKTKIATLLCEQLCGERIVNKEKHSNYTILTANAEWDNYEMIGGVSPTVDSATQQVIYKFKDGIVTDTVRKCINSLQELEKPHYLVIDEFNRANIDEAFGKLFTVFEYRDKQALLEADQNDGAELKVPRQYRIIGTMNAKDKNTLFDMGYALMRRFAFIEVGLPEKKDEYDRLNHFVRLRLQDLGISFPKKLDGTRFPNDPDDVANELYEKLMAFVEEESLPQEGEEIPRGVRTYRQIGTAQLIDCMVTILNAPEGYPQKDAMEGSIISNILPQLENLEKSQIANIYLKALKVFGKRSAVTLALDRMIKSPMLSIFG